MNKKFEQRNKTKIRSMAKDPKLRNMSKLWFWRSYKYEYSYHFKWLGRPIIQYPQDMVMIQEIIWKVRPDLIIETGIAHGGSLILSASILEMIGKGNVLGIDIDIRPHNKVEIEKHPLSKRITMIEGSSVDEEVVKRVYKFAKNKKKIMVILDSNHIHEHVLQELRHYSPLVTRGSYLVVFDTIIEDMPRQFLKKKPWKNGNNPSTAIKEFLKANPYFIYDKEIDNKLLISAAPNGYLRRIR